MKEKFSSISKGAEFHKSLMARLSKLEGAKSTAGAKKEKPGYGPAHRLAAFLHWFSRPSLIQGLDDLPDDLKGKGEFATQKDELDALFERCEYKYGADSKDLLWQIGTRLRKDILASFKDDEDALHQWLSYLGDAGNTVERFLKKVLRKQWPNVQELDKKELRALLKARSWAEGAVSTLPDKNMIDYQLRFLEIIEPFYKLTENFRGRKKQLLTLRSYVDYLSSESTSESITRRIGRFTSFLSLKDHPPLVITGVGGAGKSTLIAEFILAHVDAQRQKKGAASDDLLFVYIDFDHGRASIREPLGVLREVVHQMAMRFVDHREDWKMLGRELIDHIGIGDTSSPRSLRVENMAQQKVAYSTSGAYEQQGFLERFTELYDQSTQSIEAPILLVLDSFEEVQRFGDTVLIQFFDFFREWIDLVPTLRLVIVGRASIPKHIITTKEIRLTAFDKEAARGYLDQKLKGSDGKLSDPKLIDYIVENFELYPLTLNLIVEVLKKTAFDKASISDVNDRAFFEMKVDQSRIQQELFNRNLDHIQDPHARKIAFPGMIVRSIAVDVIREVLAEPCGLGAIDEEQAKHIFAQLSKEKFLVDIHQGERLIFRKDLRQLILPLVAQKNRAISQEIHRRAIAYFGARTDTASAAEHVYHQLVLTNDPESIQSLLKPGLDQFLSSSLDELPPRSHLFVANHYGIPIPQEIIESANADDWTATMVEAIKNALESKASVRGMEAVSERLKERAKRPPNSPLFIWEAWLFYHLGRLKESRRALRNASEISDSLVLKEIADRVHKLEALHHEYAEEYQEAFRCTRSELAVYVDRRTWLPDVLDALRQLVRLYFRSGRPDSFALQIRDVLSDLTGIFTERALSNRELDQLIAQILSPFLPVAQQVIDSMAILRRMRSSWVDPTLKLIGKKVDEQSTGEIETFRADLEQVEHFIQSYDPERREAQLYGDAAHFDRTFAKLRGKIKNDTSLEQIALDVLGVPLRQYADPGAFEVRRFTFYLIVEYLGNMADLENALEPKKAPKATKKSETPQEQDTSAGTSGTSRPTAETLVEIRQLIARDDLSAALGKLHVVAKGIDEQSENEAILLSGRLARLEKNLMRGVVTNSHVNIERNRIIGALLSLVDDVQGRIS